jgi:RimJ/RimL family protein N-acetyltransferase
LKSSGDTTSTDAIEVADGLRLRPVRAATATAGDPDVQLLTDGRNAHVQAFLTEFVATNERTAAWLRQVVTPNPGKVLFVLEGEDGPVGYMGLDFIDWDARSGEIDAIVRVHPRHPGAMSTGTQSLIAWARSELDLDEINVRVRSDNLALEFYRRLGFRELARVPLRREPDPAGERTVWSEDPALADPELWLVHHRYEPAAR